MTGALTLIAGIEIRTGTEYGRPAGFLCPGREAGEEDGGACELTLAGIIVASRIALLPR
jgi:hypothetical protein